jgi:hypothetical protein
MGRESDVHMEVQTALGTNLAVQFFVCGTSSQNFHFILAYFSNGKQYKFIIFEICEGM